MGFRGLAVLALLCVSVFGAPGDRKWAFPLTGPVSVPAFSSSGDAIVADASGQVYSVTSAGAARWFAAGADQTNNAPVVGADGTIYLAGRRLTALDGAGAVKWIYPAASVPIPAQGAFQTPVLGPDGVVYSSFVEPGQETRLAAVNADGSPRWTITGDFTTPFAVQADGSLIYLKRAAFGRLNPDGIPLWEVPFLDPHEFPVSLTADGSILLPVQSAVAGVGRIQVYAPTGAPVGFHEIANPIGTAVGPDGKLYIAANSGLVRALGPARDFLWERLLPVGTAPSQVLGAPAVGADGLVYVTVGGSLYCLDASGTVVWSHPSGFAFATPPLLAFDGTVLFGAFDSPATPGALIAVETAGTGVSSLGWPMHLRTPARNAALAAQLELPSVPTGVRGSVDLFTDKIVVTWTSAPDAVYYDIYRQPSDQSSEPVLIARNITGRTSYEDRPPLPATGYRYFVEARNALGASGRSAFGSGRRRVANLGEVSWSFAASGGIQPGPAIGPEGQVYFASADGFLHRVQQGGAPAWRFAFGGTVAGPITLAEDMVYFTSDGLPAGSFGLRAVATDGLLRWELPLNGSAVPGLALAADGTLYLGDEAASEDTSARLLAISREGAVKWAFPVEGGLSHPPMIGAEGRVYLASRLGVIYCVSAAGAELWRIATEDLQLSGPIQNSPGLLLFGGQEIRGVNPDGQVRWSFPTIGGGVVRAVDVFDQVIAQADGHALVLGAAGDEIWRAPLSGTPGDTFATDADWRIYANLSDRIAVLSFVGEPLGTFASGANLRAGPVLAGGEVLFGDDAGLLSAVRIDFPPNTSAWPITGFDSRNTRRQISASAPFEVPQVAASQGTGPNVAVTWTSVLGATDYDVFRSGSRVLAQATQVGQVTGRLAFEDEAVLVGRSYFYWVRARNAAGTGQFSDVASGFRQPPNLGDLMGEWSFDGQVSGPPAFAGQLVCVGISAPDDTRFGQAGVHALESAGELRWSLPINARRVWPPSIGADSTIYVAAEPGLPLTAVNTNGTVRWTAPVIGNLTGTPALGRFGRIHCATDQGRVHAFATNGVALWTYDAGQPISAPLAVGPGDSVVVATDDGVIHSLSSDGTLRWKASTQGTPVGDHPRQIVSVDANGVIYFGSVNSSAGSLHPDGTVRWRLAGGVAFAAPLIRPDGTALVLRPEGHLAALDAAGNTLWSYSMGAPPTTFAVAGELANYVCSADGQLHAVSSRGAKLWTIQLPAPARNLGVGPSGIIYIGAADGRLRALYELSPQLGQQWTGYQGDVRRTGRVTGNIAIPTPPAAISASLNLYTNRVELSWSSVPGAWYYEIWRGTGPAGDFLLPIAQLSGTNQLTDRSIEADQIYTYAVRAGNDAGVGPFSASVDGGRRSNVPGDILAESLFDFTVPRGLAAADGQIVLASEAGLRAFGVDLTPRWSLDSAGQGYFPPAIASDGTILAGRSDFVLAACQPHGAVRWSITNLGAINGLPVLTPGGQVYYYAGETLAAANLAGEAAPSSVAAAALGSAPVLAADGVVYALPEKQALAAYAPGGGELWRVALPAVPSGAPAIGSDGTIYLPCESGQLCAVRRAGFLAWAYASGVVAAAGPPVISPLGTIYFGAGSSLQAVGPDGTPAWAVDLPGAVEEAPAVASDGTVYAVTRAGTIHAVSEKGGVLWQAALDRGVLAAPLFLADGRLILASEVSLLALHTGKRPADFPWPTAGQNIRRAGRSTALVRLDPEPAGGVYANGSVTFRPVLSGGGAITNLILRRNGEILVVATDPSAPLIWQGLLPGTNHFVLEITDAVGRGFVQHVPIVRAELILTQTLSPPSDLILKTQRAPGWRYVLEASPDLINWSAGAAPVLNDAEVIWVLPAIHLNGPATLYRARAEPE